jgi:predicted thioesterase
MNKHELTDVLLEMVEHAGVELILEELIQAMSSDELHANIKHLDQHLFENHFLTRED